MILCVKLSTKSRKLEYTHKNWKRSFTHVYKKETKMNSPITGERLQLPPHKVISEITLETVMSYFLTLGYRHLTVPYSSSIS